MARRLEKCPSSFPKDLNLSNLVVDQIAAFRCKVVASDVRIKDRLQFDGGNPGEVLTNVGDGNAKWLPPGDLGDIYWDVELDFTDGGGAGPFRVRNKRSFKFVGSSHIINGLTQNAITGETTIDFGSGSTGMSGCTGCSGTTGHTGATGLDGSATNTGATGGTGQTGQTGEMGHTGHTGNDGATGMPGSAFATGHTGGTGHTGYTGAIGFTGEMGFTGATGEMGDTGDPGATGEMGFTGATGEMGVTGATGEMGVTGATGDQGIQGVTGTTGDQGIQGVTGATGDQGIQGVTGATGDQGIQGVTGATGDQGIQGVTGATGDQGIQGVTGATGSNASSVTMTFSYGNNSVMYISTNNTGTYVSKSVILFQGSDTVGTPTIITIIAEQTTGMGVGSGLVRIYDTTHANTIAAITTISAASPTIYDLGAISNVSTGQAQWDVQLDSGSANTVRVYSVSIVI